MKKKTCFVFSRKATVTNREKPVKLTAREISYIEEPKKEHKRVSRHFTRDWQTAQRQTAEIPPSFIKEILNYSI